jgi:hypothetical protein
VNTISTAIYQALGLASAGLSVLGLGQSAAYQVKAMRPTPAPTMQAQTVQCPPQTTPTIVQMSDGSYRVECGQGVR